MDFILFNASLRGYSYSQKKDSPSTQDVARLLQDGRAICLGKMFDYAPVNVEEIKKLADQVPKLSSLGELANYFESVKPSALEAKFRPFITMPQKTDEELAKAKGDPIDFAWSCFIHFLIEKLEPTKLPESTNSVKEIRLAANYQGWVAIKKCDVTKSKDKEILASLVGIYSTINKKIPDFTTSDKDGLSTFTDEFLKNYPERKSYARLPLLLKDVEKGVGSAKKFFAPGFENEAMTYLLTNGMARCGYTPFITTDAINGNYPELKIPKPKGNFGKKK